MSILHIKNPKWCKGLPTLHYDLADPQKKNVILVGLNATL